MKRKFFSISLVIAFFSFASVSIAQEKSSEQRGMNHFQRGKEFAKNKRFREAITEWKESYRFKPMPKTLYNIALASIYLNEEEEALQFFEKYLKEAPDGPGAPQARDQIKRIRIKIQKEEEIAKEKEKTEAENREKETLKQKENLLTGSEQAEKKKTLLESPLPSIGDEKADGNKRWQWIAIGLACMAGGLTLDLGLQSSRNGQVDALDFTPLVLYGAGITSFTFAF